MDDHQANIERLLELHAEVNPEVQVTVEQLCKEFPIFVRGLACTLVDVKQLSKDLNLLQTNVRMLVALANAESDRITHLQDRVLKLEMDKLNG